MTTLSTDQWKTLLKSTKFFEVFDDNEVDKIINCSDLLHFSMHKYIIKQNEKDFSFFVIVKGNAHVIRKTASATDKKLLTINTGECFGEMAIITKKPRNNFIIAASDCYVIKINVATIDSFEEPIQLKLYKQFSTVLVARLLKLGVAD